MCNYNYPINGCPQDYFQQYRQIENREQAPNNNYQLNLYPTIATPPPLPPGYMWLPTFLTQANGHLFPVYQAAPINRNFYINSQVGQQKPNLSETEEKTKNIFANILQPELNKETIDQDEIGEYQDASVLPFSLQELTLSSRQEEKEQINTFLSPASVSTVQNEEHLYDEVLKKYLSTSPESRYPYRYEKKYVEAPNTTQSIQKQSMQKRGKYRSAALHYLPAKIIEKLPELKHFREKIIGKEGDPLINFKIPCQAEIDLKDPLLLIDALFELTLTLEGNLLHSFLRPIKEDDEAYIKKHLSNFKEKYQEARSEYAFPSLKEASRKQDSKKIKFPTEKKPIDDGYAMTFLSSYGFKIIIQKA